MEITNAAQILIDDTAKAVLTVQGFSQTGSDYDRFKRLCICADRTPDAPVFKYLQAKFEDVLSIPLRLSSENRNQIWTLAWEKLLSSEPNLNAAAEQAPVFEILPPETAPIPSDSLYLLNGMQISARTWSEWRDQAWLQMQDAVEAGKRLTVEIPADVSVQKNSLYSVERHLSGMEPNGSVWCAQLLYVLCDFCRKSDLRGTVICRADLSKLHGILQHVSKLTPIPCLFLQCENKEPNTLLELCRMILKDRNDGEEGNPPILLTDVQSH